MAESFTKQRELASLYCFYKSLKNQPLAESMTYAGYTARGISGDAKLSLIDEGIKTIWGEPNIRNGNLKKEDVYSYHFQGQALKDFLSRQGGASKNYKYGRFDGLQGARLPSPFTLNTSIYDDIWNLFDAKHRQLFATKATGQKDSWQPADVYLFSGSETAVLNDIKAIKEATNDLPPVVFVAQVNQYLVKLFKENILIGISLKASTPPNEPKAVAFNTEYDQDFSPPKFGEAKIIKTSNGFVHQYMQLENKGGSGFLDFIGNSISFQAEVSMDGTSPLKYSWESKSPSENNAHVTEMKDMVRGNKENSLARANARGGSITKDIKFQPLIAEFTGKNWNHFVPRVGELTTDGLINRYAKFWSGYYLVLKNNPIVTLDDVYIKDKRGKVVVANGTRQGTVEYFTELFRIDAADSAYVEAKYNLKKSRKFAANLRGKLRGLIIISAIVKAKKAGRLGEFLTRAYYTAGKIKFTVDDLYAPYIKIQ